jgi:3-oxosteroid 1-dehydrogenase
MAHESALRKEYREPSTGVWNKTIHEDTGDMILAAKKHGAATDLMDEAIWTPVSVTPEGVPIAHLWEGLAAACDRR